MNVIFDSDGLLGLVRPLDPHHGRAKRIFQHLLSRGARFFLLPTTVSEFALVATSRIGVLETKKAVARWLSTEITLLPIAEALTHSAHALYEQQTSKEESLFDCFVMVIARQHAMDCIFSFDRGYTKNGFVLAEDFFKNRVVA